jgi:hypothetical protein
MRYCFSKALAAFSIFVAATAISQNVIIENEYVRAGVNLSTGTLGSCGSRSDQWAGSRGNGCLDGRCGRWAAGGGGGVAESTKDKGSGGAFPWLRLG